MGLPRAGHRRPFLLCPLTERNVVAQKLGKRPGTTVLIGAVRLLTSRETFVGELIADVAEEVLALRFGVEKLLVSFGGKGEVPIYVAAVEAKVKNAPWRLVGFGC